ncbi:MAG: exosortase/archaeosortase family protein [Phycisphaerae bacterium]|nr:exosortase/archaeosortase family protein [Phycisphaerae bacterium]
MAEKTGSSVGRASPLAENHCAGTPAFAGGAGPGPKLSCGDARPTWRQIGPHGFVKIVILGGLLGFLFRGAIAGLVELWVTDPNWSHGFLIPLFSLYFIHQKKREILSLEYVCDPLLDLRRGRRPRPLRPGQTRANYWGLFVLLFVLAFYVFNVVSPAGYAYLRPVSLIAAVAAVVLFLGGWRLVRCTWLPIAFLAFAVPLPRRYYVGLTLPMRHLSAVVATTFLNLLHEVDATTSGAVIEILYQGQRLEPALNVAEACSGMRLLMAFLALGVAMAYLHDRPRWQRAVLLLSTVPIAILCNIVRVTATGFLYVLVDPKYTQGLYHDLLGLAMLPLAFGLYGLLAWFLASLFVEEDEKAGNDVIVRKRLPNG